MTLSFSISKSRSMPWLLAIFLVWSLNYDMTLAASHGRSRINMAQAPAPTPAPDLRAREDQASNPGPITTEMATCGFWDGDSALPNDWPGHTCRLEPSLSMYHWCPTSITKGHKDYKSCAPIAKCQDMYNCYKGCGASESVREALTVTCSETSLACFVDFFTLGPGTIYSERGCALINEDLTRHMSTNTMGEDELKSFYRTNTFETPSLTQMTTFENIQSQKATSPTLSTSASPASSTLGSSVNNTATSSTSSLKTFQGFQSPTSSSLVPTTSSTDSDGAAPGQNSACELPLSGARVVSSSFLKNANSTLRSLSSTMMPGTASTTVALIVSSAVAALVLGKAWRLYDFFFCPPKQPLHRYKIFEALPTKESTEPPTENNAWALITGSSAGIGFGYAHYLLSHGFGVVILAHENIPAAVEQLRTLHPDMASKDRIKGITMNCTTASPVEIKNLISEVSQLPITILINNVGSIPISYPHMRPFRDYDAEGIDACINLNARFMTHMTCLMIPVLRRNVEPSGGRALVLNVTSQAHLGMPLLSMYSASKGHVTALSAALTREFRVFGEPIDCLCIVPNEVRSQGNSVAPPGSVVDVDYARMCLERVEKAVDSGMTAVVPYWKHYLQAVAAGLIGEERFTVEVMKAMEAKRDGLAKIWGPEGSEANM
ncbi:hypothetical protein MCOR25_000643 [Pyricularia grisea]|nr:hypothetical protein MCOR25_000643 [Pyricularia grisea]